jgi:hypothetical protein
MKIRTITSGFNAGSGTSGRGLRRVVEATLELKRIYEREGYEVQTVRLATQPWQAYCPDPVRIADKAAALEEPLLASGIDFFSIGTTTRAEHVPALYDVIKRTRTGFCTVLAAGRGGIDLDCLRRSARLIKKLARLNGDGFSNLRFAVCFNTPPGTPFFPAAYHKGPASFGIGLENGDLVYRAFSEAGDYEKAADALRRLMTREYAAVEGIALRAADTLKLKYGGIDVSVAPSVKRNQSVAFGCERLGLGRFGEAGTLAVTRMITGVIKGLEVRKCGYSGLMLPVLEDFGLARRNSEGGFDVTHLLAYSAVCGTGLDTIPLPGDVSERRLYALLLDIAALSEKLNKPLSARLMPIPGKRAGEMTEFDFPYFANTRIMPL